MPTAKPKIAHLEDRGLLHIFGDDAKTLLDGLITCDLDRVSVDKARLGALLSPQGKILFDFLIIEAGVAQGGGYFLDCANSIVTDFKKRLGFYRLRAKVEIQDVSGQFSILAEWDAGTPDTRVLHFTDPRLAALGQRVLCKKEHLHEHALTASADAYHAHRIQLGVPEGGKDFAFSEAFPHEALMDQLHGVDFDKGCYVGQEVVSRMQHRGTARTRFIRFDYEGSPLPAGTDIKAGDIVIGKTGTSSADSGPVFSGLALLRVDKATDALAAGKAISADRHPLRLNSGDLARFTSINQKD